MEHIEQLSLVSAETLHERLPPVQLRMYYETLLRTLHGPHARCFEDDLRDILNVSHELLFFAVFDRQVVGMVQASLLITPPERRVMLSNLVVAHSHRRCGIGKRLVASLLDEAKARWGQRGPLRVFLTNAPGQGNVEFFSELHFVPRHGATLTIVWEQLI